MPVPWNGDPRAARRLIERNIAAVVRRIRDEAPRREPPTVAIAQQWHRDIYQGVSLPVPYYAGEIRDRDSRFPELIAYEVAVGPFHGVGSANVPAALQGFERSLQQAISPLDAAVPAGGKPRTARELTGVVQLAGVAHGEWIRIHPFANGNGRPARLWVVWIAARFGLPRQWETGPPVGSVDRGPLWATPVSPPETSSGQHPIRGGRQHVHAWQPPPNAALPG